MSEQGVMQAPSLYQIRYCGTRRAWSGKTVGLSSKTVDYSMQAVANEKRPIKNEYDDAANNACREQGHECRLPAER